MTKVFQAWRIQESQRRYDPRTGQMTEWESRDSWFEVGGEAEEYISEVLGERFGITPFFLMNLTRHPATWAAVLFTSIIEHSDEVLNARDELHNEIGFAAYGKAKPGMSNPPLGAMAVRSVKALKEAAGRHHVFKRAWEALETCNPDENWVAVVDL